MTQILVGDCREVLRSLPDESVHCVVTSPPYWGLRDYGVDGQVGLEPDFNSYVANMVDVFREVRRVLRSDGTLWLNLGDSYCSGGRTTWRSGVSENKGQNVLNNMPRPAQPKELKPKDLIGLPWRVAFALQADGWWLRQDIIWSKRNPMPESVTDRCTKAHEYLFLMTKSPRYFFDSAAIQEPAAFVVKPDAPLSGDYSTGSGRNDGNLHRSGGFPSKDMRNKRSVWNLASQPYKAAHFATFPPALIEPCIKAGCPEGGTVLDPFAGAGTTGMVAERLQRNAILIELNPAYADMARVRISADKEKASAC